jgi:SCF-associated factor 1
LGLGHPDLPNTPLAIPPPLPHEEPAAATPTAATPAPGLVQRAQAFLPPMPATPAYLSSLLPGGLLGGPGPAVVPRRHVNPPERVDKPTEIIFDGEGQLSTVDGGRGGAPGPASTPTTRTKRNKFVYSITAGGWHSGCLAVDLNPDEGSRAAAGAKVETPVIDCYPAQAVRSSPSGEAAPLTPATDAAGAGLGGINVRAGPFRIGFAGRGANRGAGGSGLTRGGGGATYRRPLDDSAS